MVKDKCWFEWLILNVFPWLVTETEPTENPPNPPEPERSNTPKSNRSAVLSVMNGVRRKGWVVIEAQFICSCRHVGFRNLLGEQHEIGRKQSDNHSKPHLKEICSTLRTRYKCIRKIKWTLIWFFRDPECILKYIWWSNTAVIGLLWLAHIAPHRGCTVMVPDSNKEAIQRKELWTTDIRAAL